MHDRSFGEQVGRMLVRSMQKDHDEIEGLLEERGRTCEKHGSFADAARITEDVKRALSHRESRTDTMNYALDMIAGKLGRIDNGDPFYADHWRDIAGYATLVANELAREGAAE
jgi:hypothetical protein